MYLSTENLCNSEHTHYSTYCISPKTSLTTREQLHVKVSLRYITEHLSQVLWTLRTSWERLRSWRGCGMPSWSSCTLCAPWRSPSTSSQSWWRMAACWSTSRVRQPTSTRDYELLYDWVRVRCCCSMKTISPPEAKARDVSQSNYIILFSPVSTLCPHTHISQNEFYFHGLGECQRVVQWLINQYPCVQNPFLVPGHPTLPLTLSWVWIFFFF